MHAHPPLVVAPTLDVPHDVAQLRERDAALLAPRDATRRSMLVQIGKVHRVVV